MILHRPSPLIVVLALLTVQVFFGISYVASKIVVKAVPPLIWADIRIFCASLVMFAIAFLRGKRESSPPGFYTSLIKLAIFGIVINQAAFLLGLHYTSATNSAILNTMIPLFTVLIVTLRGQERFTLTRLIGFFLALLGVLILRKIENFSFSDQTLIGDLFTLVNCVSYSIFLSIGKSIMEQNDRVWTTAWLFSYGTIGLTLIALPDWMSFHWPPMDGLLLACMAFAVVGGTIVTYFLNFWALAHTRTSSVALFIYLQPVVASALAWIWFDELITLRTALSSALIFIGVLFALPRGKKIALSKA